MIDRSLFSFVWLIDSHLVLGYATEEIAMRLGDVSVAFFLLLSILCQTKHEYDMAGRSMKGRKLQM
jgi:hypothetical protein